MSMSIQSTFKNPFRALVLTGAVAGALLLGPQAVEAKTVLRLTDVSSDKHPNHDAYKAMAERIKERTNGEVTLELFPNSALGTSQEQMEQLQRGAVDLALVSAHQLQTINPRVLLHRAPYVFDGYDHVRSFMTGPGKAWWEKEVADSGFTYIAPFEWGFRQMSNALRPINSPDDLNGMKMRVTNDPMLQTLFRSLGANVVTMNFQEVYMGLATKAIDGQDNPINITYDVKFHEVIDHFALTNHAYTTAILIANNASWNELTDEQKAIFQEEADKAGAIAHEAVKALDKEVLGIFKEAGIKITEPDPAPFRALMKETYEYVDGAAGGQGAMDEFIALVDSARK